MKKMYLVYYNGTWEGFYRAPIFITKDEEKAKAYAAKFNRILKKWKDYFDVTLEKERFNLGEETNTYDRYMQLVNIEGCYYIAIELR